MIIAFAGLLRLVIIFFAQADAGDTGTYELFAQNILRGCGLSYSNPHSSECVLTSGGYYPGYPAFIASIWLLFGKSVYAVLLAQLACYLAALGWLLFALIRLTASIKVMMTVGVLLAFSPLQVGWFRFILTEPLAIATATWLLAEIIISIANRKLRVFHLALALSVSFFIRPDSIFMLLGICLIAFYICDFKNAFKQIVIVVLLATMPVSAWMIRNYNIGLPVLSMTAGATPSAPGYFLWLDSWIVNEYERSDSNFPVWRAEYSKINIHKSKYISDDEFIKAQQLIRKLSEFDGQKFPNEIDSQFYELATGKTFLRSNFIAIQIYFERALWLILNPFSSWGLPLEMKTLNKEAVSDAIKNKDLVQLNELLSGYQAVIFGKIIIFIYRVLIFLTFTFMLFLATYKQIFNYFKSEPSEIRPIVYAVALAGLARLTFFIYMGGLESRYLVELVPWVEFCCGLWLIRSFGFEIPVIQKNSPQGSIAII
jgi:hypothetical protein